MGFRFRVWCELMVRGSSTLGLVWGGGGGLRVFQGLRSRVHGFSGFSAHHMLLDQMKAYQKPPELVEFARGFRQNGNRDIHTVRHNFKMQMELNPWTLLCSNNPAISKFTFSPQPLQTKPSAIPNLQSFLGLGVSSSRLRRFRAVEGFRGLGSLGPHSCWPRTWAGVWVQTASSEVWLKPLQSLNPKL